MKVAFIGLGRMGQAMARRLLEAGHEVVIFNRTPSKAAELIAAGAATADTASEAARRTGLVLTMLSDDAALADVGAQLVDSLPPGGVHVAMGTHGVGVVRALSDAHNSHGQSLVSAPMLGRPEVVAAGKAAVVAAGPQTALTLCAPLFEALGRHTFHAGDDPVGAAAVKVANNFLLGCAIEALSEAFSLVEKSGVNPSVFHEVVTDGLFASPAYITYAKIIADKQFDHVGFSARLALKDVGLALAAGEAAGVPLPSANVWRDRLIGAIAHGDGERDWSVLALEQARAAGLV